MSSPAVIPVEYFSDLLCVWAYAAEIRLDELRRQFGARVELRYHFIPLFGCTDCRAHGDWKDQGGLRGFGAKVRETAQQFPHVSVHPEIWTRNVPSSSGTAHHLLKAVQLLQRDGLIDAAPQTHLNGKTVFEAVTWDLRLAFFHDLENIAERSVQLAIAERHHLPIAPLLSYLDSGAAMALLCQDTDLRDKYKISGSPSLVLNEGRQVLYGNVGYQLIAANVEELLDQPRNSPSWC
ncbi:MAG: DsbA family oxidoreductase [Gammaproteobacteria bacterium]